LLDEVLHHRVGQLLASDAIQIEPLPGQTELPGAEPGCFSSQHLAY
jgi:hypothetical protein